MNDLLSTWILRMLGRTWRLNWHGFDRLEAARQMSSRGNVIYALWHRSLTILTYTHRHRNIQVLVSQHHDGERMAQILSRLGYGLVRGSTQRGGNEALFGLAKQLEDGRDIAVTVDGPLGPRYSVHSGVVLLARRTGCPIVPVIPTAMNCHFLNTWDAQLLPQPFTQVHIQHGEAVQVSPKIKDQGVLQVVQSLEKQLQNLTQSEELKRYGRQVEMRDIQDHRSFLEKASDRPRPTLFLRNLSRVHGSLRSLDTRLRPRHSGKGIRPWVVGVGNLEAGGTGKTPVLIILSQEFHKLGLRTGILTRGYGGQLGRRNPELVTPKNQASAADETRLYFESTGTHAEIVVSRNKTRGLALLRDRNRCDIVLIDDAFQSAGIEVDRHLVLLDWQRPLHNGFLLPAGRLREKPQALRRADAILFTRAREHIVPQHPAWSHLGPKHCFLAVEELAALTYPDAREVEGAELRGIKVVLVSGIGRPRAFEELTLEYARHHDFTVRRSVRLGDHADLEPELRKLIRLLPRLESTHIVMTRKDYARLPEGHKWNEPLLIAKQRLVIPDLSQLVGVLVPPNDQSSAQSATLTDTDART